MFRARSALNPSPTDNTFLGLHHTGIEFKPTADNFSDASTGVEKLETMALAESYDLALVLYPLNSLRNVLLPLPLAPVMTKILKSKSFKSLGAE